MRTDKGAPSVPDIKIITALKSGSVESIFCSFKDLFYFNKSEISDFLKSTEKIFFTQNNLNGIKFEGNFHQKMKLYRSMILKHCRCLRFQV